MEQLEKDSRINLRLSEYDARVLNQVIAKHPQLTSESDLLRLTIRCWDIEANDKNSKSNRLGRLEDRLSRVEERLTVLESKMELILNLLSSKLQ